MEVQLYELEGIWYEVGVKSQYGKLREIFKKRVGVNCQYGKLMEIFKKRFGVNCQYGRLRETFKELGVNCQYLYLWNQQYMLEEKNGRNGHLWLHPPVREQANINI
jgi:hypothetical protein